MKKIVFSLLILWLITSCFFVSKRAHERFQNIDTKKVAGSIRIGSVKEGLNKKIEAVNFDPYSTLYLPTIFDTVYGIRLDNTSEALLVSVEKLRLTDDAYANL